MLSPEVKAKIEAHFAKFPIGLRERPATETELQAFESAFGAIPDDYRWLLATCGDGVIGSERVDGIMQLANSHTQFSREFGLAQGWTIRDIFIIGWDSGGNPFGIERGSGRIMVEEHQFGGIHPLTANLQEFILI